jgi:hypothetical protein
VALNRAGQFDVASATLAQASLRVSRYDDAGSSALAGDLGMESRLMEAPMSELDRKSVHFRAANLARSRDASGHARRRA